MRLMRKARSLVATIALALLLTGCAGLSIPGLDSGRSVLQGGGSLTLPVNNPITREHVYALYASYATAQRVAVEYRRLPMCRASQSAMLSAPCARRAVLIKISETDRVIGPMLRSLRQFVRENDQVNAFRVASAVRGAIIELQTVAQGGA